MPVHRSGPCLADPCLHSEHSSTMLARPTQTGRFFSFVQRWSWAGSLASASRGQGLAMSTVLLLDCRLTPHPSPGEIRHGLRELMSATGAPFRLHCLGLRLILADFSLVTQQRPSSASLGLGSLGCLCSRLSNQSPFEPSRIVSDIIQAI